ncbi:hypothetical protein Rhopal_003867-T1 [Rhodotorula paludigena]|uniref:Major facilitator superfamily (MFS) profile domain-containing protein n=1 Tax=Rhodotorula paludigena TaxID=86838 RepID=A0AAV5GKW1_9BASI|nr:hypothetical protein Rhopal_003867-T1 [Rhodotorula paludigena]
MSKTFRDVENATASSWWKDPSLRKNVGCAIVVRLDDGSYLNGLQSLATWNTYFDNPSGNRLGLISASSYLPSLVLLPLYAMSCDYFGRKPTAMLGSVILIGGAILGALATNEGMLIAGRALVGVAGSLIALSTNLLCNETLHPRLRSIGAAFFLVFYYMGSITSAWIAYGVIAADWSSDWSWRLPTLVQAAGPIIVLIGCFFIPESPRFLIARGKRERAITVLANQHANGQKDDPLVQHELEEIEEALEREKRERTGFMSFFKTKGNRHRLLIVLTTGTGSQANGVAIFSYYLAPALRLVGVTSALDQTVYNGGMQIYNLGLAVVGAALVERVGRRKLWLTSTGGMLVSYICLLGLSAGFDKSQNPQMGLATVAFMFLCYGWYDIAWTPLAFSYTTECLPYSLRSSGMALFTWMQNAALSANQWLNPVGLEAIGWKFYFVFLATLIMYLVLIYFLFVETRGLSLEEVALLFDNEATSLAGKKEAADAQVKFNNKQKEIEHVERKLSKDESV